MFKYTRYLLSTSKKIASLQNSYSNITPKILELVDRRLLSIPNHPLTITKELISDYFNKQQPTQAIPSKIPKYKVIIYNIYR